MSKSFKFIHAADIHLDSPLRGLERYEGAPVEQIRQSSRRALENLVQLAINEKVAFVVIAGDLFDGDWRDYNTGLYFIKQMSRLHEAGCRVYLLKGNHDAANKLSKSLPLPANVHVFSHRQAETFILEDLNIALHGQSFAASDVKEDLSQNYPAPLSGFFNIGVLHTCVGGREGHDSYAPCKLDALVARGYDYWALGHVHKREILCRDPLIVFPGNIQGRHIRETGAKGCMLISVNEKLEANEEFCELSVLRWELLQIDLSKVETLDELFSLIAESIASVLEKADSMPLALRVQLQGRSSLDSVLRSQSRQIVESVRAIALQKGAEQIWIEKLKISTEPELAHSGEHFEGPLQELLQIFEEANSDSELLLELEAELQELKARLPAELPELRGSGSENYLQKGLSDAKQILLERLLKISG